MNRPQRFFRYIIPLLLLGMTSGLHAAEVNKRQRLAPAQQAKVNSVLAKSYVYQGSAATDAAAAAQGMDCGATQLGTVQPKTRATRVDNTFVARGDVIVVNRNVHCR